MSFTKIKKIIIKNKNILLFLSFLFLIIVPDFAFAVGGDSASGDSNMILDFLNGFVKIATILLGLITNFVGWFMTPAWTTGSAIGIRGHLKDLWIMMSNIVYLIFAFILIWIALMNILGKSGDWELKQALPRFIAGVLIVPFSWLIVGAIISLSSVLSVSVLTLPQDSFPEYKSLLDKETFCTTFKLNLAGGDGGEIPMECVKGSEKTIDKYLEDSNNVFGIINTYTYSIMHIDANGKLFSDDIMKGVNNIFDLTVKGIVDILFVLIYFILMIALLLALFVRGVYMWLYMVISPLFGLMFFFKDKGPDGFKNFTLSKFVGLALMPVYVSAALSFGLLFIMISGSHMAESDCKQKDTVCLKYDQKPTVEFLGFKMILEGGSFGGASDPDRETNFKESFAQIIMQIFGLSILRIAVMAALGSSEITKEVIAPIKSFGDSVGQLAMKAPTYAPIIPAPGGGTMSARSLGTFGTNMASNIDSHFQKKGSALSEKFSPHTDDTQKVINNLNTSGVKDYRDTSSDKIVSNVLPALKELKNASNKDQFDKLVNTLKNLHILKEDAKLNYSNRMNSNFAKIVKDSMEDKVKANSNTRLDDLRDYQTIFGDKEKTKKDLNKKDGSTTENKKVDIIINNKKLFNGDDVDKKEAKYFYKNNKKALDSGEFNFIDKIGLSSEQETKLKSALKDISKSDNDGDSADGGN